MNHMEQIAKVFDLELDTWFRIKGDGGLTQMFKMTTKGILDEYGFNYNNLFFLIARGELQIEKLFGKINRGGTVWYYNISSDSVQSKCFGNLTEDMAMFKLGKYYLTPEEAEMHKEEDKKFWKQVEKERVSQ